MSAARTREVAELLRRVAGRPLPNAELQSLLAICAVEGMANWSGDMSGSWNLGSVQCTKAQIAAGGGSTFTCVNHVDHHADGSSYTTGFRYYHDAQGRSAAENGAAGFMSQVYAPIRPRTGELLRRGGSLYEIADAMHREHYYEGDARGGKDPILGYAQALDTRARQVAAELGQPQAVSLYAGPGASGGSSINGVLLLLIAGGLAWLFFGGK
jgi:hypothetical protein